jgi:hypothetical protein
MTKPPTLDVLFPWSAPEPAVAAKTVTCLAMLNELSPDMALEVCEHLMFNTLQRQRWPNSHTELVITSALQNIGEALKANLKAQPQKPR